MTAGGGSRGASASRLVARLCAGAVGAAGGWVAVRTAFPDGPVGVGDAHVYRDAVAAVDSGTALYDFTTTNGLGFTYPPVAAVLLRPLSWVPATAFEATWSVVCLVALAWTAWLVTAALAPVPLPRPWLALGVVGVLGLGVQAQSGLVAGNLSLVIIALCLADVGEAVPPSWRGALVGLTSAVKLTPLVFAPGLLAMRRHRAALVAVATATGLTLAGVLLAPEDSWRYWTQVVLAGDSIGDPRYSGNESATGFVARMGVGAPFATVLGVGVGAVVVLVALWRIRVDDAVHPVAAAVSLGCASTVMSPFSWPFHLLWLPLAGVLLLAGRRWSDVLLGGIVLATSVLWGVSGEVAAGLHLTAALVEVPLLLSAAVALRRPTHVRETALPPLRRRRSGAEPIVRPAGASS